jgi:hypothetical protein
MSRVSARLDKQVRERAKNRCEYCQAQQIIIVKLQIDHILPQSHGGQDALDNLCLACINCNESKHDALTGQDPVTRSDVPLFNPRTQHWAEHFAWSEDRDLLTGLTASGRATIERLQINSEIRVTARRNWVKAGWHPPKD